MSIVVPFQPQPSVMGSSPPTPAPGEPFALMAAAQMHSEGRLVEPQKTSDDRAPIMQDLKQGQWGSNPAELYNTYKKGGASNEDAREGVIRSLMKGSGKSREQIEDKLRKVPMS